SAAALYGGSAIGGVVNIILKEHYSGGEIRLTNDDTFEARSPMRSAALTYGFTVLGGRTHVMLNAAWSKSSPLLFGDRLALYRRNIDIISRNAPTYLYGTINPPLGTSPNIFNTSGEALVLKSTGESIGSHITHISPGTAPGIDPEARAAMLQTNAGSYNLEPPPTAQQPAGLRRPLGATPRTHSFSI